MFSCAKLPVQCTRDEQFPFILPASANPCFHALPPCGPLRKSHPWAFFFEEETEQEDRDSPVKDVWFLTGIQETLCPQRIPVRRSHNQCDAVCQSSASLHPMLFLADRCRGQGCPGPSPWGIRLHPSEAGKHNLHFSLCV